MWQFECFPTPRTESFENNSTLVLMASARNDNKIGSQFSSCRDSVTHRMAQKTRTIKPVALPSSTTSSSYSSLSSCSFLNYYRILLIVTLQLFLLLILPLHHNTTPLKQIPMVITCAACAKNTSVCLSLNSHAERDYYNTINSAHRGRSSLYFSPFPSFFACAEEEKDVPVSFDSVFSDWGFVTTLDAAGMGTGVITRSPETREGVAEEDGKTPQSAVDGSVTLVGDNIAELVKPSVISYLYSAVAADIGQELGVPTFSVEIARVEASRVAISLRTSSLYPPAAAVTTSLSSTTTLPCVTIRFRIMSTTRISGLIVGIWASALNLTDLTPKLSVTSALAAGSSQLSSMSASAPIASSSSSLPSSFTLTPALWMNGTQSLYRDVLKGLPLLLSTNSNSLYNNFNNNADEGAGVGVISVASSASELSSSSSTASSGLLTLPALSFAAAVALSPPTRPVQFLGQCGPAGCIVAVAVGTLVSWFTVAFVALTVRAAFCSDHRRFTSESHRKSKEEEEEGPWDVNGRDEGDSTCASHSDSLSSPTSAADFGGEERVWRGERDFDSLDHDGGTTEQGGHGGGDSTMYQIVNPSHDHGGEAYENERERGYEYFQRWPHHRLPPTSTTYTATNFVSSRTHHRPAEAGPRSRDSLMLVLPKGPHSDRFEKLRHDDDDDDDDDDDAAVSYSLYPDAWAGNKYKYKKRSSLSDHRAHYNGDDYRYADSHNYDDNYGYGENGITTPEAHNGQREREVEGVSHHYMYGHAGKEEEGLGRGAQEELASPESDNDFGASQSLAGRRRSPTAGGRNSAHKFTHDLLRESDREAFDYQDVVIRRKGRTQDPYASSDGKRKYIRYGEGLDCREREPNANDVNDRDDENGNDGTSEVQDTSNRLGTKSPFANYYFGNNYQCQPHL